MSAAGEAQARRARRRAIARARHRMSAAGEAKDAAARAGRSQGSKSGNRALRTPRIEVLAMRLGARPASALDRSRRS